MRVRVLGCGASGGVPLIGCACAVCRSDDPRNVRTRASILIESGAERVLIDTSPDLRAQLLGCAVGRLDAVVYTHCHADHVHGIDDLRSINYLIDGALDAYGTQATLDQIRARFGYAFAARPPTHWVRPALTPRPIAGAFSIGSLAILPFAQDHGHGGEATLGLRIGAFAYSTDVKTLDEAAFTALRGVRVWLVDCLRPTPNPAHSHLAQTLEWIARVRPERAILTHMSHDLDYGELAATLPAGVEPAYDGLVIDIDP